MLLVNGRNSSVISPMLKPTGSLSSTGGSYTTAFFRAAFKFGRRVHCALRRKMRKPPITRVPAILNGLTNRPSDERHGHA